MGSATHARSLAPAIENSKKLSLEIHLPVFRLHSSSVSTAYRRCGIVIDPPTIRPTLKASKNSSSVTLVSTHWMIWYVTQSRSEERRVGKEYRSQWVGYR